MFLNDVFYYDGGYLGYVTDEQLTWLRADMGRLERGVLVVLFLHIPLYTGHEKRQGLPTTGISFVVTNREAVYRLLEPFRALVLSGHLHESDFTFEGRTHERNHGAVCGAWWSGDICWDGTPNGYGVYQVRGTEIRWRYQSTGQDFSYQLRVYPHGADPKAPDEILANVWDWDPAWTVVWYEDGERNGAMSRRVGLDPLSVKLHTGPDLPRKRGWVEPQMTGHLFYASASRRVREIRVEATDRWGTTYTETLRAQ